MTDNSWKLSATPSEVRSVPEDAEVIHLRDYWRILVRRRRVALACLGAVVVLTAIFTFLSPPVYRATATLQIERQGPEILNFNDVLSVDAAGYQDFYQTQYKILQSQAVLTLAAERIDLLHRAEYASRSPSPIVRLAERVRSLFSSGDGSDEDAEEALEYLEHSIAIRPVRKSHLVRVSFFDQSPALARDTANAVVAAYQQFNLDAQYSTTKQANEFLTKQVVQLQAEIAEKERALQDYGVQKEILTLRDSTQDINSQALSAMNAAYVAAKGRLALAEARNNAVQGAPPDALPDVLNSPLISRLKQQLSEIERRYGQMAERFRSDWPALRELQQELEGAYERLELERQVIAAQVRSVTQADYEKARAEVASLGRRVDDQKTEVQRVSKDAIKYAGLLAEIQTKRQFLDELVNRRSQTEVSDQLRDTRASNMRVVDAARTPKYPVRPRKALNMLLSLVLGAIVAVGSAFLIDHLDNRIKEPSEVERLTGLPVLGHIAHVRAPAENALPGTIDIGCFEDSRSAFAEAFRNLRTSLLFASPDRPPRHVVVTSCEAGDGKSTVSVNLAIALTQMDRRVLLVDADLRRPRVFKMLGVPNKIGLSNVLTGNARLEDAIQESGVPQLDVLTSGPIPPAPSELLGSPSLQALLDRLAGEGLYDHIILDTTPSLQISDSVILASRTDATIIVIRCRKTARESLTQALTRLRQAHVYVVGTVLNDVPAQGSYYYYSPTEYGADETGSEPGPSLTRRERRARKAGAGSA